MAQHRLSVIVTTHLRPVLLRRALASVLALGQDVQIVLCADEGSDQTRLVAAQMLRPSDVFVAAPHLRGPSQTRNLGLSLATGGWIIFLDDDDTLDPCVFDVLPILTSDCVIYTHYRKVFETRPDALLGQGDEITPLRVVPRNTARKPIGTVMAKNFLPVGCFFTPLAMAQPLAFRADLTSSEDWEFLMQLYQTAPFRHADFVTYNWHITEAEASRDKVRRKVRAQNCRKIYALHPVADAQIHQLRIARLAELGDTAPPDWPAPL